MADEKLLAQALAALTDLRFVLDCALGINAIRPEDADGPAVKADAAVKALRARLADVSEARCTAVRCTCTPSLMLTCDRMTSRAEAPHG